MVLAADKPGDRFSPLLQSLQPERPTAAQAAHANEAQQRWPLFRAMPPQRQPDPEPLADDARSLWQSPAEPAPSAPPAEPNAPAMGTLLAQGLGRITQSAAHSTETALRAARSMHATGAPPAVHTAPAEPPPAPSPAPIPEPAPEPVQPPQRAFAAASPAASPLATPPAPHPPTHPPFAAMHPSPPLRDGMAVPPAHGVHSHQPAVAQPAVHPTQTAAAPTMPHPPSTLPHDPARTPPPTVATQSSATQAIPPAASQAVSSAPAASPPLHGLFQKSAGQADAIENAAKSSEPLKSLFRRLENPNAPPEKSTAKKSTLFGRLRKRP